MAKARHPATFGGFRDGMGDDDGAIMKLLERIAFALNVPVERPVDEESVHPHKAPAPHFQESLVEPEISLVQYAKMVLAARRARESILPPELLGEPSFDLLINSYVAWSEKKDVPLADACAASGAPPSIALRWIALLVNRGLLERADAQAGGGFRSIRLKEEGVQLVTRCLQAQQRSHPQELL